MKIVKPYAKIMPFSSAGSAFGITAGPMSRIEWCARISHRAEDAQTPNSWQRFIKGVVLDHGDWSVVEHVSATVDMLVDRGITHELVRHRLFSFTQESTRFVNYEKKMPPSFIYPKPEIECEECLAGYEPWTLTEGWVHIVDEDLKRVTLESFPVEVNTKVCNYSPVWLAAITKAEAQYKILLKEGWRPQEARSVLPNALASRIVVTGNLRNWRHLFIMRTTIETHPQFRQVSIPLLAEFQEKFPLLFDDIKPLARQIDNLRLPR